MPDEIKSDAPITSHETVVNTKATSETLDANGKNIPANTNLGSIFDKIEAGVDRKDAIKEVMAKDKSPKAEPKEVKETKEIKVVSSHPEKKDDEIPASGLDDALTRNQEKKDDETPAPVADDKKDEDVPEDELKVLPHDKPKTAKRISALLQKVAKADETVATTRKEKEERDAELKKLQDQLASVKTLDPKTEEEIAAAKKELAMFRRRYDLDKDPELKQKYDERIDQADASIPDILKKNNAGEGLINLIKEEGGWSKFSKSNRMVTLSDGTKVSTAELADQIVNALPFSDRKTVDSLTTEQITLKREKDRFVEQELKAADEFFKKRDQEQNLGREAQQKQVKDAQEAIDKWQKKVRLENAFLKEKEVPADATSEQKKSIEEDNATAKELNEVMAKNLAVKDMDGILNVVLEAVQYHKEKKQNAKILSEVNKLKSELKAKSDELDRIKSSRTTAKAGSLVGGGSSASSSSSKEKKPASLEDAFNALESARSGGDE